MTNPIVPKPIPLPDRDSAPFWEATRRRELVFQRCSDCGRQRFPVGPVCPDCQSFAFAWERHNGRGAIHSFMVAHYQANPNFPTPYTVLLVDLDEGPRLVGRLEAPAGTPVTIGDRVHIGWEDIEDQTIHHFLLDREEA
jgi:uncharacterized OB-fold protein